ncbi:SxtJ family membrane protein [Polynucleobacter sp. JS-JIR-5-A7]|uniref:SxtJ family membrane protein n=1 Tax=Polynucleobacter sp. JS-JIR-5-A7 TaxID=1758395 RepID=UPI001BFD9D6B|nr:SxtJ family membrane protein [Polynucleobacter sp. JS-JIR-5-A7]QWE06953.1 hypothetical protein AOC29_01750 [Polynucleobacter sp. JS-JIR-5-A7]
MSSNSNFVGMPSNEKFGWVFSVIFIVTSTYFFGKQTAVPAIASLILAILFVLTTSFTPIILAPLNKAWFLLGLYLGRVVSPIILSFIFFLLVTPVALITQQLGMDPLRLKRRQVSSYWIEKEPLAAYSFKNQF